MGYIIKCFRRDIIHFIMNGHGEYVVRSFNSKKLIFPIGIPKNYELGVSNISFINNAYNIRDGSYLQVSFYEVSTNDRKYGSILDLQIHPAPGFYLNFESFRDELLRMFYLSTDLNLVDKVLVSPDYKVSWRLGYIRDSVLDILSSEIVYRMYRKVYLNLFTELISHRMTTQNGYFRILPDKTHMDFVCRLRMSTDIKNLLGLGNSNILCPWYGLKAISPFQSNMLSSFDITCDEVENKRNFGSKIRTIPLYSDCGAFNFIEFEAIEFFPLTNFLHNSLNFNYSDEILSVYFSIILRPRND